MQFVIDKLLPSMKIKEKMLIKPYKELKKHKIMSDVLEYLIQIDGDKFTKDEIEKITEIIYTNLDDMIIEISARYIVNIPDISDIQALNREIVAKLDLFLKNFGFVRHIKDGDFFKPGETDEEFKKRIMKEFKSE